MNVRSTLLVLTLTLVGTVPSYAVDNVRKTTLEINGTTYTFPVGDKEREMDTYWLKKAVGGDREALDSSWVVPMRDYSTSVMICPRGSW